jgi:hypothetical protein
VRWNGTQEMEVRSTGMVVGDGKGGGVTEAFQKKEIK